MKIHARCLLSVVMIALQIHMIHAMDTKQLISTDLASCALLGISPRISSERSHQRQNALLSVSEKRAAYVAAFRRERPLSYQKITIDLGMGKSTVVRSMKEVFIQASVLLGPCNSLVNNIQEVYAKLNSIESMYYTIDFLIEIRTILYTLEPVVKQSKQEKRDITILSQAINNALQGIDKEIIRISQRRTRQQ
jgi:hypothetical protein